MNWGFYGPAHDVAAASDHWLVLPLLAVFSVAAFRSGAVMGFMLAGFGLLNLFLAIIVFLKVRH